MMEHVQLLNRPRLGADEIHHDSPDGEPEEEDANIDCCCREPPS